MNSNIILKIEINCNIKKNLLFMGKYSFNILYESRNSRVA